MLSADQGAGPVENGSNHSLPDDDDDERDEERERQQRLYNVHQQVRDDDVYNNLNQLVGH